MTFATCLDISDGIRLSATFGLSSANCSIPALLFTMLDTVGSCSFDVTFAYPSSVANFYLVFSRDLYNFASCIYLLNRDS